MRPVFGFSPVRGQFVHNGDQAKRWVWDGMPKRCPKKGERFLSGALPCAYMADVDMTTEYFIVVPYKG